MYGSNTYNGSNTFWNVNFQLQFFIIEKGSKLSPQKRKKHNLAYKIETKINFGINNMYNQNNNHHSLNQMKTYIKIINIKILKKSHRW